MTSRAATDAMERERKSRARQFGHVLLLSPRPSNHFVPHSVWKLCPHFRIFSPGAAVPDSVQMLHSVSAGRRSSLSTPTCRNLRRHVLAVAGEAPAPDGWRSCGLIRNSDSDSSVAGICLTLWNDVFVSAMASDPREVLFGCSVLSFGGSCVPSAYIVYFNLNLFTKRTKLQVSVRVEGKCRLKTGLVSPASQGQRTNVYTIRTKHPSPH